MPAVGQAKQMRGVVCQVALADSTQQVLNHPPVATASELTAGCTVGACAGDDGGSNRQRHEKEAVV